MSRFKLENSLKAYKGEHYYDINNALRENIYDNLDKIDDEIKNHIINIDSVMKNGSKNITVYRGIPTIKNFIKDGNRIIDLGFCSVTTDINVTNKFTDKNGCCVVTFILPPEIKRHDFSDKRYENEILIERNTQLILDNDEYEIGQNNLKIYTAVIKKYEPPLITKKDLLNLSELKKENLQKENAMILVDDLKEFSNEMDMEITKKDIDDIIETKKESLKLTKSDIEKLKKQMLEILNFNFRSKVSKRKASPKRNSSPKRKASPKRKTSPKRKASPKRRTKY